LGSGIIFARQRRHLLKIGRASYRRTLKHAGTCRCRILASKLPIVVSFGVGVELASNVVSSSILARNGVESCQLAIAMSCVNVTMIPDADDPTRLCLQNCNQSTPMSAMPRWRSQLRGSHVRSINSVPVHSIQDVKCIITEQHQLRQTTVTI
jgi:hypothetical protein